MVTNLALKKGQIEGKWQESIKRKMGKLQKDRNGEI